jgi:hypothetical protein
MCKYDLTRVILAWCKAALESSNITKCSCKIGLVNEPEQENKSHINYKAPLEELSLQKHFE